MAEYLTCGPLAGTVAFLQSLWSQPLEVLLQLCRGRFQNAKERLVAKQSQGSRGVRIGCSCHDRWMSVGRSKTREINAAPATVPAFLPARAGCQRAARWPCRIQASGA